MIFRKDINGLRAIAILAVMIFHFIPSWMPGGFAGVDVFFVISGFLMTAIIFKGIENDSFSILKFYISRANRIIPALSTLCLVLFIFGWLYLTELDLRTLSKHIASSLGFVSNMIYWSESGYFDAASKEKWLLHTWSLSVEWQFYIIYPLLLVVMKKMMPLQRMKQVMLIGTLFAFIGGVYITFQSPNSGYYIFPARAWEMMLGGLAFLYPIHLSENRKKGLEMVGVILIVYAYLRFTEKDLWPGYLAIIPTLGAFFIIQAQRNNSFITGNIVFQKLGKWSYSIYLWHWPVVVIIYHYTLSNVFVYVGLILSIALGYLSNRFVENIKFRNDFSGFFSYLKCKPLWMVVILGLLSSLTFIQYNHLLHKISPERYEMASYEAGYCFGSPGAKKSDKKYLDCKLGNRDKNTDILLFGDSFAGQYEPMLDEVAKTLDIAIQSITTNSCYPSLTNEFHHDHYHVGYQQCLMNRKYVKDHIEKYKYIFITARWDEYFDDHRDSISEVADWVKYANAHGVTVIYLPNSNIYQSNVSNEYISSLMSNRSFESDFKLNEKSLRYTQHAENLLRDKLSESDEFLAISKNELFPGNTFKYHNEQVPYPSDDGHITVFASKNLAEKLLETKEMIRIKEQFHDK